MKKDLKRTPEEIARWRERAQFIEDVLERMGPPLLRPTKPPEPGPKKGRFKD